MRSPLWETGSIKGGRGCRQHSTIRGGGVVAEAHSLLAKPHAPGKEERLEQVKEKNAEEDQTFVSEAAAVVVAASTSEPDEESGLKRRPQKSSIHR